MAENKIRVILQARSGSSRLPAKMLLPLCDMPLVVLCAKRVTQGFNDFVVATSDQASDDMLAQTIEKHDIPCIRGSLDDVLSRFVTATQDMQDDDWAVRLTGDNPCVDSAFIQGLMRAHEAQDRPYTRTLSPQDGFPYGLSAEVMRVGSLREIAASNPNAYEREHVTIKPTLEGRYHLYKNEGERDLSRLRLTIDTFEDYVFMRRVFERAGDWTVPWQDLVESALKECDLPFVFVPRKYRGINHHSHMALGTVQLGLDYGIANQTGKPDHDEAKSILQEALRHGITIIDTAMAYGESESIIGTALSESQKQESCIITKLDPFAGLNDSMSAEDVIARVKRSIFKSLSDLNVKTLRVLMLHRWDHVGFKDGVILKTLLRLRKQGWINKIGVSVQLPQEGLAALDHDHIEFIQFPLNILDKRWEKAGFFDKAEGKPDTHIQSRSVYLQGLLAMDPQEWPKKFEPYAVQVAPALKEALHITGQQNYGSLALGFVRAQDRIDSIAIGVETLPQLHHNIEMFNTDLMTAPQCQDIMNLMPEMPEQFLNPARWGELDER